MQWLKAARQLFRDVVLTGTGVYVLVVQAQSASPSWEAMAVGLVAMIPAARVHAAALLASWSRLPGPGPSSPPASSPLPLPSSPPPGAPDA